MDLEAYLQRYGKGEERVKIHSVLRFPIPSDDTAEKILRRNQQKEFYPGVAYSRTGNTIEIHLAAIKREGHLDYLERMFDFLVACNPQVISVLPATISIDTSTSTV